MASKGALRRAEEGASVEYSPKGGAPAKDTAAKAGPSSTGPSSTEPSGTDLSGADPSSQEPSSPVKAEVHKTPALDPYPLPEGWRAFVYPGGLSFEKVLPRSVFQEATGATRPASLAVKLTAHLESSSETNAGRGSALRLDGRSIECDAVVLDTSGRQGTVLNVRATPEPILLAQALYRAGGATVVGTAADELAIRLGLKLSSLETAEARRAYHADFAHAIHTGSVPGPLLQLYADPSGTAGVLTTDSARPAAPHSRDPVFALIYDASETGTLALSTGGIPLALPGSPGRLSGMSEFHALGEEGAILLLPGDTDCALSAQDLYLDLEKHLPLKALSRRVEETCSDVWYLLVTPSAAHSNIPETRLLKLPPRSPESEPVASESDGSAPAALPAASVMSPGPAKPPAATKPPAAVKQPMPVKPAAPPPTPDTSPAPTKKGAVP